MSNNGLPVTDVVGVSVTLGQRRTAGASAGDAYAQAAQGSAISAANSAAKASQAEQGAVAATNGINEKAEQVAIDADRAETAAENAQNIADANTYYTSPTDPDGTIAGIAGTPDGKIFRVAINDDSGVTVIFKYYKNAAGTAEYINAEASARLIYQMEQAVNYMKLISPQGQSNTLSGYQVMVTDFTGKNGLFGVNDNGGFEVLGIDGDLQDYLTNLVSAAFSSKISGYQVVIFAQDLKSVIFAIDDDGGLWLPGLDEPVQDAIGASGPSFVRPYNGWNALFANKDSQIPLWSRQPVISVTPVTKNGVSFVYEENGVLKSGLMPTKWPANEVYGPPCELSPIAREVHAYLGRGQSLRVGGGNRISTLNPLFKGRLFMFSGAGQDRGAGVPTDGPVSDEALAGFTDAQPLASRQSCQTPALYRIAKRHIDRGVAPVDIPSMFTRMDARSGTGYAGLKRGTQPYIDGLTSCQAFADRVRAVGKIPVIKCIGITHGEDDAGSGTVTQFGDYKAMLEEWVNDSNADMMPITGQTTPIIWDVDQMGGWIRTVWEPTGRTVYGDIVSIDQWEFMLSRSDVIMSCPKFPLNRMFPSDFQHLTNVGYAVLGEYQGQAEDFTIYDPAGSRWKPVQPETITKVNENTFDIGFHSPFGGALRFNTSIGSAPNSGIDLGLASTTVTSVTQTADKTFRVVTGAAPAANDWFRFGFNANDPRTINGVTFIHPLVNISDDSQISSEYVSGLKLVNWCVGSRIFIPA
ncbi:hypothetical protein [Serratia marcescens]|uniref:hypothetical protein n=1 Tax=Serratia marcescens TaxID=615 RepID=UPI0002AF3700|nr:hypothetical protein [Serratia marcescens]AGE17760.1 hypothetical protein SMWW4_v1c19590 [Serratia marcescens WW4]MDP8858684.1 hypothetical protein [Serratia marcescens]